MSSVSQAVSFVPTLYVPVHKRADSRSRSRSGSSSRSPRSTTPTSEHGSSSESQLPIYSIHDLLVLSKSPLSTLPSEQRDHLKDTVPEITLSRRQRKAIEHRQIVKAHAEAARSRSKESQSPRQPLTPMHNPQQTMAQRRTPRQTRLPDRRRPGKKILDERSWRTPTQARNIPAPLLLLNMASA
ncbi:hypothetical protein GYMLUDRAFT_36092 [Collybiopsis luxurians FD-317 M1]|nr:hypothetical protein GYMLUDRAFT_36092 [Collybiopsis luxurians FD-317 M1]